MRDHKKTKPVGSAIPTGFFNTFAKCLHGEFNSNISGFTRSDDYEELPWVIRLARWLALIYAVGYVTHCFMNWFF